jgi:hypothetical protein
MPVLVMPAVTVTVLAVAADALPFHHRVTYPGAPHPELKLTR